jgi:hypothetical protein
MNSPDPGLARLSMLLDAHAVSGNRRQRPIPWPRGRWLSWLPQHSDVIERLPSSLDRTAVRSTAESPTTGDQALAGFLAAMIWGFGNSGSRALARLPSVGRASRSARRLARGGQSRSRGCSRSLRSRGRTSTTSDWAGVCDKVPILLRSRVKWVPSDLGPSGGWMAARACWIPHQSGAMVCSDLPSLSRFDQDMGQRTPYFPSARGGVDLPRHGRWAMVRSLDVVNHSCGALLDLVSPRAHIGVRGVNLRSQR